MALINLNFKKTYTIKAKCANCKVLQDLTIPKGRQIADFLKSEECLCDNCGCSTLTLLSN